MGSMESFSLLMFGITMIIFGLIAIPLFGSILGWLAWVPLAIGVLALFWLFKGKH